MSQTFKLTDEQIARLHQLYQAEWWTQGRTLADTEAVVRGSQICIAEQTAAGELIGFVRVITDYIFKALILDLIVAEAHRDAGVGQRLLEAVASHPQLASVGHFELYCLPELQAYYEKLGFSSDVGGILLMRKAQT